MNLEELLNRQDQLNRNLSEVVQRLESICERLTGDYKEKDNNGDGEIPYPSGLINQLQFLQDVGQVRIEKISEYLYNVETVVYNKEVEAPVIDRMYEDNY